jgi:hypothetical protein
MRNPIPAVMTALSSKNQSYALPSAALHYCHKKAHSMNYGPLKKFGIAL